MTKSDNYVVRHSLPTASVALATVNRVTRYALLAVAIACEVAATLSLRASHDHPAWFSAVVAGYTGAFALLIMVVRTGAPVGATYGVWGATGTAATAALGAALFGDPFTWPVLAGIAVIIAGVLLVEFGSRRPSDKEAAQ